MSPARLSRRELAIAEAISRIAFVNPFSEERQKFDRELSSLFGSDASLPLSWREPLELWAAYLPPEKTRWTNYRDKERELMRIACLFLVYERFLPDLDALIQREAEQEKTQPVRFAEACLRRMEEAGFERDDAIRFFSIFYQLRRGHHFIVHGLKGISPCMKDFRRRLWNNVFTSNVRWYDEFLWDKMEDFSTMFAGETGTGKGTAACAIGRSGYIPFNAGKGEFAENFNRCFVSLNLAQFPETLLEAELFGYRKGAFTGAVQAHEGIFAQCSPHGSIFLDEIGEVSPAVQIKLLNVLQERIFTPVGSREKKRFKGRVITATNQPLRQLLEQGRFREDFFYRISSDVVEAPTLKQRLREDAGELDLLLEAILLRMTGSGALVESVRERLHQSPGSGYAWPGNVRELEQATRRILVTGQYIPEDRRPASGELAWTRRAMELDLTADELLQCYCRHAHAKLATRAEVARKLNLDPRTVSSYLSSPVQSNSPSSSSSISSET